MPTSKLGDITPSPPSPIKEEGFFSSRSFRKHQQRLVPYLFIAPNIALFTAFSFLPLVYAVYISLHDWGLIGEPGFIGMRNYLRLWQDPLFWRALANTLLYAAGTVPTAMVIGLLLALALDRRLPARALFRSL